MCNSENMTSSGNMTWPHVFTYYALWLSGDILQIRATIGAVKQTMRNPICMLQQLNWMRMEIACGSLSDLTGWLKRWCSFCRERKSLCLPLSACQCNYNHRGTRGGPWYPVDYGLNNMLEMRSVSLGLLCVRTGAVMYVYFCICLVRWIGSSTYWFPDCTSTKKKGTNHSFGQFITLTLA